MVLVVGAAIVRDDRLLVARRTAPAALAGGWELPGGKVEPGEPPEAAVVREVAEELGCEIRVVGWLDGEQAIDGAHVLRAAHCVLVEGEPAAGGDHDRVCWAGPAELEALDWLAPDRPFVPALLALLP